VHGASRSGRVAWCGGPSEIRGREERRRCPADAGRTPRRWRPPRGVRRGWAIAAGLELRFQELQTVRDPGGVELRGFGHRAPVDEISRAGHSTFAPGVQSPVGIRPCTRRA